MFGEHTIEIPFPFLEIHEQKIIPNGKHTYNRNVINNVILKLNTLHNKILYICMQRFSIVVEK